MKRTIESIKKKPSKEVHICPIKMRTVIFSEEKCMEACKEENYPLQVLFEARQGIIQNGE